MFVLSGFNANLNTVNETHIVIVWLNQRDKL